MANIGNLDPASWVRFELPKFSEFEVSDPRACVRGESRRVRDSEVKVARTPPITDGITIVLDIVIISVSKYRDVEAFNVGYVYILS